MGPRLSQAGARGAANRAARETGREGRSGQKGGCKPGTPPGDGQARDGWGLLPEGGEVTGGWPRGSDLCRRSLQPLQARLLDLLGPAGRTGEDGQGRKEAEMAQSLEEQRGEAR